MIVKHTQHGTLNDQIDTVEFEGPTYRLIPSTTRMPLSEYIFLLRTTKTEAEFRRKFWGRCQITNQ